MPNNYKIIFSLRIKRETSFKPFLYLVIYIRVKRFCVKILIIFLFLEAISGKKKTC
jgi:hypothetical protein